MKQAVRHAHAPAGLEKTEVHRAKSVQDACSALAAAHAAGKRAMALAGGTDVIVDRHLLPVERATAVDVVVDLTHIPNFHGIATRDDAGSQRLHMDGGVTYWDLRQSAVVAAEIPMLAHMAKDVGAVQIQTRGTLAGNVASASPAADGVAALLALDGRLHLEGPGGKRRILPLADTFLAYRKTAIAPDEVIAAIDVRIPKKEALVQWRKVGTRLAQAISKVALASVVEKDGDAFTHVGFGMASVAAVTHGLPNTRMFVRSQKASSVDANGLDRAIESDIKPIDDVRSTGEYRLHVAKALVRNVVLGS